MDNKTFEMLLKSFLIIVGIYIIVILLIKRFIYFKPSSQFVVSGETYKSIHNGHLHAWLVENEQSNKIILFCHGNGGNISHRDKKLKAMKELGYSILIFDYSGYGKSTGVPSEQQLYDDASTMAAFLLQKYQPKQIILYGESIGCPVATYVARKYSIPTLILESPLPSIKIFVEYKYKFIKWFSFLFPEFDTMKYLNGYKGRTLLLHSTTDEIIPYSSTIHLHKFITSHIPMGGYHNNPIIPWNNIKLFIEQ